MCVCVSVCLSVCLFVCLRGYLRNHTRDLYRIFVHVAYSRIFRYEGTISLKFTHLLQCWREFNFLLLKGII